MFSLFPARCGSFATTFGRTAFLTAGLGLQMVGPLVQAKQLEISFEGTVVNTNGVTTTVMNLNSKPAGYERMYYGATPASPFDLPTAQQTAVNGTRTYSLLGAPVQMRFTIDLDKLPAPLLSTATGAEYMSRLSSGSYTPWLTGSLTLNGVTQTYVGDRSARTYVADADPSQSAKTYLNLDLGSQIAPDAPAGYQFYTRLLMNVQIPLDLLNGPGFDQNFNFTAANATDSRKFFYGFFSVFNGHHDASKAWGSWQDIPDLTEDSGYIRVASMNMRTIDTTVPTTTVPEPGMIEMVLAGALVVPMALAWQRKRRGR